MAPPSKYYLYYQTAISYFENHQLFYAKPLLIGKCGEALNYETRINSTIPSALGIPELKNNLIEGVVIKPLNKLVDMNLPQRPIVKLKNKEFEEEDKFQQAKKWSFTPSVSSKSELISYLRRT
ncbi:MAG: hypothetical protein HRT68_16090 [Flavobacteriaceae bacterium]|nr:hypothetical protein [Flavobacteriaceae bacterium]